MTTPTDERLRMLLNELADDMPAMPLLERLEPARRPVSSRRRAVLGLVAVAAAVLLLVAGVAALHPSTPQFVEPTVTPPHVFRLATSVSDRPGTAQVAVLPAPSEDGVSRSANLWTADDGQTIELRSSGRVPSAFAQSLSWDGTHLVRQNDAAGDPRLEVVDLRTGRQNELGGRGGYCPQLSPDNRTVAAFSSASTEGLDLIDVRSGRLVVTKLGGVRVDSACSSLGWSPTGDRLVVGGPAGSTVVDNDGRVVARLPHRVAVNGNQSWSPDGQSVLTYDRRAGRFVIDDLTTGDESVLPATGPDALRPLGWAGNRVVWLEGPVRDRRLVSTDRAGEDRRTWMRLEVGDRGIDTVQWSWAVSGRPLPGTR